MRTVFRATSLLLLAIVNVGVLTASCGLVKPKKGGEDAATAESATAEVPDAGALPAPSALASNEGDIARFPDETAINSEPATLKQAFSVRESPPAGAVVASLAKGTAVTKVASRDKFFLVVFDNPKAPGTKLMGWVHRDAFSAIVADAGPLVCPSGEIALFGDVPFCGKQCTTDAECPARQACKGQANKLAKAGKGESVTVCTAFTARDGGATAQPAAVDAGRAAPQAVSGGDVVTPVGSACPQNFLLVSKTGRCHRPCPTAKECKNEPSFCIRCGARKVCGESAAQCK